ncbi:hypothetical protein Ahia01_000356200, partial [Argonauta hians]
ESIHQVYISLSSEELQMCEQESTPLIPLYAANQSDESLQTKVVFLGERHRNREDFTLQMYQDEVTVWIEEEEKEQMSSPNTIKNTQQQSRVRTVDSEYLFHFESGSTDI